MGERQKTFHVLIHSLMYMPARPGSHQSQGLGIPRGFFSAVAEIQVPGHKSTVFQAHEQKIGLVEWPVREPEFLWDVSITSGDLLCCAATLSPIYFFSEGQMVILILLVKSLQFVSCRRELI